LLAVDINIIHAFRICDFALKGYPIDMGKSVKIHHEGQNPKRPFKEMLPNQHRGKGNDAINHPNKNKPSQIDRKEFNKAKKEYWKKEYENK